jgi:hypothetical protein
MDFDTNFDMKFHKILMILCCKSFIIKGIAYDGKYINISDLKRLTIEVR